MDLSLIRSDVLHCHPFSVDIIGRKCGCTPVPRWLRIRTRNCSWNGFFPHLFEAVHCHPPFVDNIVCKCSSSPLNNGYEFGQRIVVGMPFIPHSFEAVDCHPSSVNNIVRKSSSSALIGSQWIRTRNCCGMDLSLICLRLSIAILLLLLI